MPKALFFNIPGYGHINPSLPMVAELSRRGHQITYFATESFRKQIEATGATFRAYDGVSDDYFDRQGLSGRVPQKVAVALMRTTGEILPGLLEQARAAKPDYILYDSMCPWGYYLGQIMKVPTVVSYALTPTGSPRAMLNPKIVKLIVPMILRDFGKGIEANRRSTALGKHYQVKSLSAMQFSNAPADLGISYSSTYFTPFAESAPPYLRFVGRVLDGTPQDPSFSFEQVKGRRLIYVSLGTLNNDDVSFFQACIGAFRDSEDYVIMSTGKRIDPASFGGLPANIAAYSWVPQLDVLRRASLFVTHGGLGSIHDGLYFGVPLLMVPQQEEQGINSLRVVELGAGVKLNKTSVTPDSLRWYRKRLLNEPNFKTQAQRIGDSFREEGGAAKAANEIEVFLSRQTPVAAP